MGNIDIGKMIEKRRESVGGEGHKFLAEFDGKEFWIVAPDLAPRQVREEIKGIRADQEDEILTEFEAEDALIDAYLGDQADEFRAMCDEVEFDPMAALGLALEERDKKVKRNPTQRSSRNTRRR